MTTVYIAIGACFLLNLIVIIAFRAADRKDRTLKSVNQQVKNFRSEVSSTMNRLSATAKDCEQNISSRVEFANGVINQVADSLDMLLVHQKELSALDDVCRNYKVALEKLRSMTEQAEARIFAVQSEVRKAEAVKDFVDAFQKDTDRLKAQMENLKADYVRLVASTEQDLKTTVSIQKEENNQMLAAFEASLERYKNNLSDFMTDERQKYDEICREQEEKAQDQLDSLDAKCRETEEIFSSESEKLDDYKASLEAGLSDLSMRRDSVFADIETKTIAFRQDADRSALSLETRRDTLFTEMDNRLAELRTNIDALTTTFLSKRDEVVASVEQDINHSIDEMDNRLAGLYANVETLTATFLSKRDEVVASVEQNINRSIDELDNAIKSTEDTLEARLNDKEDEISTTMVALSDRLEEKEKAVADRIVELDGKKLETLEDIRKTLDEKKQEVLASIQDLVEERDGVLDDIQDKMDERKDEIRASLEELASERDAVVLSIQDAMEKRKQDASSAINELQNRKNGLVDSFDVYITEKSDAFKVEQARLEEDRTTYIQKCRNGMLDVLDEAKQEGNVAMNKLRTEGEDFLKLVSNSISESEKSYKLVLDAAYDKTNEACEHLEDLGSKIKASESALNKHQEEVTQAKKELWAMQQQQRTLTQELGVLFSDQSKARNEVQAAKNQRINEEANLVRLKGQQNVIAENQAKKASGKKVSIEEMDLFLGAEEPVDISDED